MSNTNKTYDVIVIGSGHNGLTAAAYLAKSGKKVLVLEKRSGIGGLAQERSLGSDYKLSGVLHDTSQVRRKVVKDLQLEKYGLKVTDRPASVFLPSITGPGINLHHDPVEAEKEIATYSPSDAKKYKDYRNFFKNIEPFVSSIFDRLPPQVYGLNFLGLWDLLKKGFSLRMLGRKDMMEILRIGPMCVADWLSEWFETDLLKAGLSGPALYGDYNGPWSPSTNAKLVIYESLARTHVEGGASALVAALAKACAEKGVDVKTDSEVAKILVKDARAYGVKLSSGVEVEAKMILSTCDPKRTFLDLIDSGKVPFALESRVQQLRSRGTAAKLHLALSKRLEFSCRPGFFPEFVRIGETLDDVERSFDPVKYGELPVVPSLDIHVASEGRKDLCPEGHSVLSIMVNFVPFALKGGWIDEQKDMLTKTVIATLERYSPGFSAHIKASELLTPADLAGEFSLTGGHLFHGEHAADQIIARPTLETSHYHTPISALYLGGSGSHPGGGLTCAPGALAAATILQN